MQHGWVMGGQQQFVVGNSMQNQQSNPFMQNAQSSLNYQVNAQNNWYQQY
jgi:hypothetical protein